MYHVIFNIKSLIKVHMDRTTLFIKRNVALFVTVAILIVAVGVSASALGRPQTYLTDTIIGGNSNQNYMMTYGPYITGSVSVGPAIAKSIESLVRISLANASTIAEKAVGTNAHAAAVRIGVVYGFLVYKALIVDSNYGFHWILVDAGNGKVLASVQSNCFYKSNV
jgi:hypothetical protein